MKGGKKLKREIQCAKCPWKKGTDPNEIPNGYSADAHCALKNTIAKGLQFGSLRAMACHESPAGNETECIGWLYHQMGPGNNIGLRLKMMAYDLSDVRTVGPQHVCFEDTLPKRRRKKK